MRILQGLVDIAGQPGLLSMALRGLGYRAQAWVYQPHAFGYGNHDQVLSPWQPNARNTRLDNSRFFLKAISQFDIWHLHKGVSFFYANKDLYIAKALGKKIVLHYRGREIRPKVGLRSLTDEIKKRLENQLKVADLVLVHDGELAELLKPLWPQPIIFPNIVLVPTEKRSRADPSKKKLRVVHIPSNPEIKGTVYVRNAVSRLENEIEYIELTKITHEEALAQFEVADLIVDQLLIGTYGNVSLEAMALGKPVLCFLRDDLSVYHPRELPIINVNTQNIYEVLRKCIRQRDWLQEVGLAGRSYVLKTHSPRCVAQQAIAHYREL